MRILIVGLMLGGGWVSAMAGDDGQCLVHVAEDPRTNVKNLRAQITIDAPPHWVWQSLTDYGDMSVRLPGYESSNLSAGPTGERQMDIALKVSPLLPTYRYRVHINENRPDYRVQFTRVSGDFKELRAIYQITPQAGGKRTLLTYELSLDTGHKIPGSQVVLKSNTEKTMRALEQYAEATYRQQVLGKR